MTYTMKVTFSKSYPGLGEQIKEIRKLSNKTLTELAYFAGISVVHWTRIENEKVDAIPVETLRGIEKALGVDLGVSE